jgi:hypothetical protein
LAPSLEKPIAMALPRPPFAQSPFSGIQGITNGEP